MTDFPEEFIARVRDMSLAEFSELPLLKLGESKEIRDPGFKHKGKRYCVIKLLPTIYSFTANRAGVVEGSDILRLRASRIFSRVLEKAGIHHAYKFIGDLFILAEWIEEDPNVEVIVKAYHSGTSKHRYYGMAGQHVRKGSLFQDYAFSDMGAYPWPIVRFDWRNPMHHPTTQARMADEPMPDDIADWWIDVRTAKKTALSVFKALSDFLATHQIVIYDLCLFIDAKGKTVFGEISPDCGRFRHFDLGELDKDVWRAGGSSTELLKKWETLVSMIESGSPP